LKRAREVFLTRGPTTRNIPYCQQVPGPKTEGKNKERTPPQGRKGTGSSTERYRKRALVGKPGMQLLGGKGVWGGRSEWKEGSERGLRNTLHAERDPSQTSVTTRGGKGRGGKTFFLEGTGKVVQAPCTALSHEQEKSLGGGNRGGDQGEEKVDVSPSSGEAQGPNPPEAK